MHEPDRKPQGIDWRRLHLWEIQPVRDVLVVLAAYGLLRLGYMLSIVTVPMLLALLLAYLFEPLVQRLIARKWFSRQGAAIAIIVSLGVLVVVPLTFGLGFAVVQGVSLAGEVAENIQAVDSAVQAELRSDATHEDRAAANQRVPRGFWTWVQGQLVEYERSRPSAVGAASAPAGVDSPPDSSESVPTAVAFAIDWLSANAQTVAKQALRTSAGALSAVASTVISLGALAFMGFLTAFFFYFFSTGYGRVLAFWHSLIPERRRGRAVDLLAKMDRVISGFVRGRLTICVVQSVFYTAAYWMIGAPAPLILGPVVGILSIAPYVPLVGVPISILLMWLEPSSASWQTTWWWVVFAPIGVYWIGQALDDYVLSPMIQGKATDMDTPSILFASLAGGALAGFYGLLLAIPVAACLKILIRELFIPRFKAWARGDAPDVLPIKNAPDVPGGRN